MRQIDQMTPQELDTLALKGMTAPRTASERPAPNKAQPRKADAATHSPLPWKVMADPSYPEGLHPLHHNRYIATEVMGVEGDDFDGEGSLICALRDQEHQAGDAALIVRAVNHADKLAEACRAYVRARNDGGISMADYSTIADTAIREALAAYEAAK